MSERRVVQTDSAPGAIGPYSQAIVAAGLVFAAGQVGLDPATRQLREGVEAQAEQAVANLRSVLEAAGSGLERVVKATIFLSDMGDFAAINEVYARAMIEPFPARSTVAVKQLPAGALVEIEVIALAGENDLAS
ncbi:MAG: Rid family detoxifying hydrolase [Chloroflexota bacterium]